MEVAIDTGPLESGHAIRGVGVNTKELIETLKKEIKQSKDLAIKLSAVDFSKTDLSKFDLVHYTAFHPYFLSIPEVKSKAKVILTIHDLIYLIYPDKYPSGFKGKINFYKNKSRLKNVDAVLTISETSKKDIVRFLKVPPEKVKVIYLAAKDIFKPINDKKLLEAIRKKYNLPTKFALFVGDTNYNKNLINLIRATEKAKIPLVIVGKKAANIKSYDDIQTMNGPRDYLRYLIGKPHPETAHYQKLLKLFSSKKIIRPGFVSDEDIAVIYNLASVYIQPSFYEGFGLPVLEAMACGTPVVVSKTNALVEVAGNAAIVVEPHDVNEISDSIKELMNNDKLRSDLSIKGIKRAKEFSWKQTAIETIEFYKEIGG